MKKFHFKNLNFYYYWTVLNCLRIKQVKKRSEYEFIKYQDLSSSSLENQHSRILHSSVNTDEATMHSFFDKSKINYSPIIKQKRYQQAKLKTPTKNRRLTKQKALSNLNKRFAFLDNQLMDAQYLNAETLQNSISLLEEAPSSTSTPEYSRQLIYFSSNETNITSKIATDSFGFLP